MKNGIPDSLPFVSVIIPSYNDEEGLYETLDAISKQTYPRESWEVLVIDNGSNDNTCHVARSFKNKLPDLTVEVELKRGSYAARNHGIRLSRGDILAFIDTDMTVDGNWIQSGVDHILKQYDYVGCPVKIYAKRKNPNFWERHNMRTGFPVKKYMTEMGFAGAGNIFVKKKVFSVVGLFDENLISGGDVEFGNRVRDAGFKQSYDEQNVMKHPARSSIKACVKKSFRTGRGWSDLEFLYPHRYPMLPTKAIIANLASVFFITKVLGPSRMKRSDKIKAWFMAAVTKFTHNLGRLVWRVKWKMGR